MVLLLKQKNPTSLLRNGVYYSSIDTPLVKVANKKTVQYYKEFLSLLNHKVN
jgi:hypothetical protein